MTAHPLFDITGRTVVLYGRDEQRLAKAASALPGDVHTAVSDVTDGPLAAAGTADVEERVARSASWSTTRGCNCAPRSWSSPTLTGAESWTPT